MSLASALAIYFIIWWLVLFMVLPFGIRNAHESGETVEEGNEPGAPVNPRLRPKGDYYDDPGNGRICGFLPGADAGPAEPRQPAILQHDASAQFETIKKGEAFTSPFLSRLAFHFPVDP